LESSSKWCWTSRRGSFAGRCSCGLSQRSPFQGSIQGPFSHCRRVQSVGAANPRRCHRQRVTSSTSIGYRSLLGESPGFLCCFRGCHACSSASHSVSIAFQAGMLKRGGRRLRGRSHQCSILLVTLYLRTVLLYYCTCILR